MAKIDLTTLKSAFETGDRPSGADYVNLIDTLASQAAELGTAGNNEVNINGIENPTVIDSFLTTEWRMVKYLVSIAKLSDNSFYATEISILNDADGIHITEYGSLDNNGDIGTVDVSRIGNTVSLVVTPNPAVKPVTVRFARMGLKV